MIWVGYGALCPEARSSSDVLLNIDIHIFPKQKHRTIYIKRVQKNILTKISSSPHGETIQQSSQPNLPSLQASLVPPDSPSISVLVSLLYSSIAASNAEVGMALIFNGEIGCAPAWNLILYDQFNTPFIYPTLTGLGCKACRRYS